MACNLLLSLLVIVSCVTISKASTLIWSEDFNGPAGSLPSSNNWNIITGGGGNGNNELEFYTNSPTNLALDGTGHLRIVAVKNSDSQYQCSTEKGTCWYTSGRITTQGHFTTQYGRVEARILMPRGNGVWPAFWLLGNNIGTDPWPGCGEIDIAEMNGRNPNQVLGVIHGPGYSGADSLHFIYSLPNNEALSDNYHIYAIEWSENSITWSVDGVNFGTRTPADLNGKQWVFNNEYFITLNMAIGGNFVGNPDDTTYFPEAMVIDYVRVYSN